MNRKLQAINQIFKLIEEKNISPGQNLPPERILAESFKVSRNTLREAIKMLEDRGVVEVRAGSGCYLKTSASQLPTLFEPTPQASSPNLAEQIEACYLFFPEMAGIAIKRLAKKQLHDLENTVIQVSQAIIKRDFESVVVGDNQFRRIIISGLENQVLIAMNLQYELDPQLLNHFMAKIPKNDMSDFFAGYVKALEAIRSGDSDKTEEVLKHHLLLMSFFLKKYAHIGFSELMQIYLNDFVVKNKLT